MTDVEAGWVRCQHPDCARMVRADTWSKIRAWDKGWFQARDGRTWCPDHVPAWVAGWRAGRGDR